MSDSGRCVEWWGGLCERQLPLHRGKKGGNEQGLQTVFSSCPQPFMNVLQYLDLSKLSITLLVCDTHTMVFTFKIEFTDIQTWSVTIYVPEFLGDGCLWLQQVQESCGHTKVKLKNAYSLGHFVLTVVFLSSSPK